MVSVIIPVYNGSELLEQCVHSVLGQSYSELEVIIIDDGSTDNSYTICEKLAAQDSRIRLVRQKNAGVSAARNRGISMASGEYILFVDADDILPPQAAEVLVEAYGSGVDLVIGSHEEFRGSSITPRAKKPELIEKSAFRTDALRVEKLVRTAWGKLYRTDIITENHIRYDEKLPFMEDTLFTWRYCKFAETIRIIDDIVYRYRLGGMASTVKYYPERCKYILAALEVYGDFYGGERNIPKDFLRAKVTGGLLDCVMHFLCHCSRKRAAEKIDEALALFKSHLNENSLDEDHQPPEVIHAIRTADTKRLMSLMYRQHYVKVLVKKAKKVYYHFFNNRI